MLAKKVLVSNLLVSALLSGCATTRIASISNFEYQLYKFSNLLVSYEVSDLHARMTIEDTMCYEFRSELVSCNPSYLVFFPGERHTKEQIQTRLKAMAIDGVLVLNLLDVGAEVSRSYQTYADWTTGVIEGRTGSSVSTTVPVETRKPWNVFNLQLLDVQSGRVAWVATAKSSGTAYNDQYDLIRSLAWETVKRLLKAKLLHRADL